MRKLKLDVEKLTVESFTPQSADETRAGTVHAHDHTRPHKICQFSCWAGCTLDVSCYEVCATPGTGPI